MRRLNSTVSSEDSEKWKIPYLDIIAVATIQFLLALLILCYGVYSMQFVQEHGFDLKTTLWTAVAYVAAFKITSPWTKSYCKHLDNIRHKVHKRNVAVAAGLLFLDLVAVSFTNAAEYQIFLYGGVGGVLSSIIYVHVKYSTSEVFKTRPRLFDTLDQIVKPFCLILMPHLVLLLSNTYGEQSSQLIMAALILNIIPACLVIKTSQYQKMPLCKFQTIDKLSIEMVDMAPKPVVTEPSSSEDEEDDDDLLQVIDKPITPPADSSTNVQMYFQNVGVKILPNIPEENEWDEDDDINEISSKRLSKISAILQGLNLSKDTSGSNTNLYQPDEIIEPVEPPEELDFVREPSVEKRRCFSISSHTKFAWKVKQRDLKMFAKEHFIRSFPRTLGKIYFYPAVVSSSITTILSTVILAAAPTVMLVKSYNRNNPMTTEESTFLLTIIGFTWIFFLAGYPVFSKLSSIKIKLLFLIGLSISGLSLYVAQRFTYDNFTLFSLSFGLGHGITSYTETIACEDFFGKGNWKKLQGALEISTGCIVIIIYLVIYLCNVEIDVLLGYAYWPYVFNVSLWVLAYVLKQVVVYVTKIKRYNRAKYPDFNF